MASIGQKWVTVALALFACVAPAACQTWSACNPVVQGGCPADAALGTSFSHDFSSPSDAFTVTGGNPSYGSNGAQLTVTNSGEAPTLSSRWYIMFGHVEFVIKAAPGAGIVSSAVLLSDALDEIDFEWLGGDNTQVQSNYFGKGQTTTGYNRGAFHGAPNNHDQFHTYTIDWTKDQIIWQVDGTTVRKMTPADAETGQYPQTPMQIKVGIWAGGDPANPPGTVQWAGGPTDYTQGPFSMYLKSIKVQDYSTGSFYSYDGTAGTWQSIRSNGGTIYTGSTGKGTPSNNDAPPPAISSASGAPMPLATDDAMSSVYATRTGWPWVVASRTAVTSSSPPPYTSIAGLPPGWIVTDTGKVMPPNAGATNIIPLCVLLVSLCFGIFVGIGT